LRIIGVSTTAFIAALFTLILIPREATRTAARLVENAHHRPDTVAMVSHVAAARIQAAAAETTLARRRVRAGAHRHALDDSLRLLASQPGLAKRRDSLAVDHAELTTLLARATRSPIPSSYRALGAARALAGNARVHTLLDSLAGVTRSRDAIARASATDPVYLALTTQITSVGHAIQTIATTKETALAADIAALTPSAAAAGLRIAKDTIAARARVDSMHRVLRTTEVGLASARRLDAALDAQIEQAQTIASGSAPPLALMTAALVLGIALGFAVTFGMELHTPRVSDAAEASRLAGATTLATLIPRTPDPERMRRDSDRDVSPLIAINSESYRYVYLSVSDADAAAALGFPLVAVTGDEAEVVAAVAVNIAVASVEDSRTTLLVDADADAGVVAGILGVTRAPGVSDVLTGRADWAGIILPAVVGRDRSLSVMPAGTPKKRRAGRDTADADTHSEIGADPKEPSGADAPPPSAAVDGAELQAELIRLGRRYDFVVVAAPAGAAQVGPDSILPVRDAVICARVAYTPLDRLVEAIGTLRESRLRVRGIVLWDADVPPRLTGS
jgi:Mrp family chromosome partitioning ATPase